MQTSDVIGSPDIKYGNVDVFSNGGRLQPGCYKNESNIRECNIILCLILHILCKLYFTSVGKALKCSNKRGMTLLKKSFQKKYKSR